MYVYEHKDGRKAGGDSTWTAMKRALGDDEANAVLDTVDLLPRGRSLDPDGNYQDLIDRATGDTVGTFR
jgi:hypothetical protein